MHRRIFAFALAAVVVTITARKLVGLDWGAVADALLALEAATLAGAFALILPALAACAAYDLIGRRQTGHELSRVRTMLISFAGYFLSLNVGALVGGVLLRLRLYTASGLRSLVAGQLVALTVLTNWLGYFAIAGVVLLVAPPWEAFGFPGGAAGLRLLGAGSLLAVSGYLVYSAFRGNTKLRIRGTAIALPDLATAGLQLALGCTNWAASGAVLAWLMPGLGWLDVMPVLMVSALAGIWSHVPGGIGVTEAVFASLLGTRLPEAEVVAAVLVFRAVYYFLPLLLALAIYAWLEWRTSGMRLATATGKNQGD
jgi:uncharacterized membrane protein YbhN (UPF0104 family)